MLRHRLGMGLCQQQGLLVAVAHRLGRVQQHAGEAGRFGKVDGQARTHHHTDAVGLEVGDAVAGFLAGLELAVGQAQGKGLGEGAHIGQVAGMGDQTHTGVDAAGTGQRGQQIKPRCLHGDQRHLDPAAQEGGIGAAGHDHIARLAGQALVNDLPGLLEGQVDGDKTGAVGKFQRHIGQQAGQARDTGGPDHRQGRR